MVSGGAEGGGLGQKEDPLRLLGYLKSNKRVAYVLMVMVMVHLSNQYDRFVIECLPAARSEYLIGAVIRTCGSGAYTDKAYRKSAAWDVCR